MQTTNSLRGTFTAIITPLTASGALDEARLKMQIERQVAGSINGIVPGGTTGESPTLSMDEHVHTIKRAVEYAGKKMLVLAGTGANSTSEALELTKAAEDVGADGSLQVCPYYNRPSQEGIFRHFCAVADATLLPLVLYNIPTRCGVDISADTVCRLKKERPNSIVGIKVANGSCDYVTELRARLGPDFFILSGDDSLTLPFAAVGANGVISVVSNVVPKVVAEMCRKLYAGNFASARETHTEIFGLTKSLFLDGNPAGVKCAMELLGLDSGVIRLPLVRVSSSTKTAIRNELVAIGLLK